MLFLSAQRLPAPIVETQEKPPEEQSKSKKRSRAKRAESDATSKTSRSAASSTPTPALQGAARFAGTWSGTVSQGLIGHVNGTFTVSPDATSVQVSQNLGGGTRNATMNGDSISWSTGGFGGTTTLTPNVDGQTAQVTLKGLLGSTSATWRRGSAASTNTPSAPVITSQGNQATQGNETVALLPSGSMSGPRPAPPPEASAQHLTGRGVFLLHFDKPTGNIIDVTVTQSTGAAALDQAAINTFRQWHATPNCPKEVPMTVNYAVAQ